MSDNGTIFHGNTVRYASDVPPSSVELVESEQKIGAGESVPDVVGFNKEITWRYFPGIPPPSEPVKFFATSHSEWNHKDIVTITGPFGENTNRTLSLEGSFTNRVAIFQEGVDN